MELSEYRLYDLQEAAFSQGKKVHEIIQPNEMAAYKKHCLERLEYQLENLSMYRAMKKRGGIKIANKEIKEMKEAISYLGAKGI